MANGSLNYTVKGICIGMKVTWNYTPPTNGGDTFTSIKKGSKATLKIVQDEKNGFVKELYIQKEPDIDNRTFEAQLQNSGTASNNLSVLICQNKRMELI